MFSCNERTQFQTARSTVNKNITFNIKEEELNSIQDKLGSMIQNSNIYEKRRKNCWFVFSIYETR